MNRLESIRAAAQRRDENKESEKNRIESIVSQKMAEVKALAPRIKELISVANELKSNGFTLGRRTHDGFFEEFVSNGIDHNTGFIDYHYNIIGVGIKGGGCNGADVVWNINGDYIQSLSENKWSDYTIKQKLDGFIKTFDGFENRFYEYVDNL